MQKKKVGGVMRRAVGANGMGQKYRVRKKTLLVKGKIDPATCGPLGFSF